MSMSSLIDGGSKIKPGLIGAPQRDAHGNLTRAGMEAAIAHGGSVLLPGDGFGRVATKVEELPSAAELAKGDEAAEKKATADIDAQMEKLQAQRDSLIRTTAARRGRPPGSNHAAQPDDPNEEARKKLAADAANAVKK